jgi:hypothetical protein
MLHFGIELTLNNYTFNKNNKTMSLSKESIEKFKEIFKKEYGKELSDQEAYESATNLMGLAEVLYKCAQKDYQRKQQLKKEPDENGVNSRAKFFQFLS